MPSSNVIQFSTSSFANSIKKGNAILGISSIEYGPTSTTGFWNGITPPSGGYTIYVSRSAPGPNIYTPSSNNELITYSSKIANIPFTNTLSALAWFATQSNSIVVNKNYPDIVTDGLSLLLDTSFTPSYPVNPSQVNLLYNNGIYTSGNGASGFGSLGVWVTESVIIPNNKFRISTGTVFRSGTEQSLRFYVPLLVLTNYQPYNLSFNYQIISGSLFRMTDWNDRSLSNNVNIDYGNYQYSASTGTTTAATPAGTYNSTFRFMDFAFGTGSIVDIWDIQLTQNVSASSFNTGSGTTWYDISGNNKNGSLINSTSYNTNNYMVFDGVDDYINIPTTLGVGNPNTVCALIKLSGSNADSVVYGPIANGSDNWLGINTNRLYMFVTETSDVNNFTFTGPTTLDTTNTRWYFITSTISGSVATIYLNGNLENTTTRPYTIGSWSGIVTDIGKRGGVSQRYFKGSITNVIGYSKALTPTEILQNYYQAPIVTDGLVFAVDASNLVSYENGSTTTYSLTGSASGSLINGIIYQNDGSWLFDGTDDRIEISSNSNLNFLNTSSYTIEVWGNLQSTGLGARMMVSRENSIGVGRDGYNFLLKDMNATTVSLAAERFASNVQTGVSTQISTNQVLNKWCQFTATYDGQFYRLYLNGNLIGTSTLTSTNITNNISQLSIGNRGTGLGNFINMKMSPVRIYNKALTQQEVAQNFNAQRQRFGI